MKKELIKNLSRELTKKTNIIGVSFNDEHYTDFMNCYDGGYFYNHSLHIYGYNDELDYHSVDNMNQIFNISYLNIFKGLKAFAEDVFGNPFCFSNDGVVYFNIETGSKELMAKDFKDWLNVLHSDLEYFTGKDLVSLMEQNKIDLSYGKRLTPRLPFILGGEYKISNLVLKDFEENIEFNSSIAKQVYNLPDGTKFEIKIKGNR